MLRKPKPDQIKVLANWLKDKSGISITELDTIPDNELYARYHKAMKDAAVSKGLFTHYLSYLGIKRVSKRFKGSNHTKAYRSVSTKRVVCSCCGGVGYTTEVIDPQ